MNRSMILLKTTLWIGIVADAAETIRMLVPGLFIATMGIQPVNSPHFGFALMYGAPVMLGWTILLVWALGDPVKRRGVYLILLPVILSYVAVEIYGVTIGLIPISWPAFGMQALLILLC